MQHLPIGKVGLGEVGMPLTLPAGLRLLAATHNPGKARELAALLDQRFNVVSAAELGLPEPDEPETTFVGNALVKARAAADASGLVAIADDFRAVRAGARRGSRVSTRPGGAARAATSATP